MLFTISITRWPLFHNGVAAGLRMSKRASHIDNNWITFNKPKDVASANGATNANGNNANNQANQNLAVRNKMI